MMARVPQPLLRSQKVVKRKKIFLGVKLILGLLVFVALVYGVSYASRLPQFAIMNIVVEGNTTLSTDEIVTVAQDTLAGGYWHYISRSNIIFFPQREMINAIKSKTLRIGDVTLERSLWNTIIIKIIERQPVAVWCGVIVNSNAACYLLDSDGFVFDQAPEFSGTAYVRMYGQISSEIPLGARYTTPERFQSIFSFVNALPGISVTPVLVETEDTEYKVTLKSNTLLRINYTDTTERLIPTLQAVIEQKHFSDTGLSTVEYIDLRFGNKIFYKMKGEVATTTTEAV